MGAGQISSAAERGGVVLDQPRQVEIRRANKSLRAADGATEKGFVVVHPNGLQNRRE